MASEGGTMSAPLRTPPRWAEFVLERLLADSDWQTVTGDLREEYTEAILPHLGPLRANLWYLRQVLSLAPRGVSRQDRTRGVLFLASVFTSTCGCWLAVMEWLLAHPGYLLRSCEDLSIALVSFGTIIALFLHLGIRIERWLWAAAVALITVAARALVHNARSTHFEGFVLLISLVLLVQSTLMLLFLGRTNSRRLRGTFNDADH
jgi:hypothetical protein